MNKNYVPYEIAIAMKQLGFKANCFGVFKNNELVITRISVSESNMLNINDCLAPTFQQAFDWFEDEYSIFVERAVFTSVNEILDFTYHLKSWRFPMIEVEFDEPTDCFDRYKSRVACLNKMIDVIKNGRT